MLVLSSVIRWRSSPGAGPGLPDVDWEEQWCHCALCELASLFTRASCTHFFSIKITDAEVEL